MGIIEIIWRFFGDNSAEIIAFCALLFTVYQFRAARHHNKLMVTPHLCIETNTEVSNQEYEMEILLKNSGIGPAVVKKFTILLDGKDLGEVDLNKMRSIVDDLLKKNTKGFTFKTYKSGYVMSEKDDDVLLNFIIPINLSTNIKELEKELDKLDLYIEYESLYGSQYTFDSRTQKNK